MQLRQQKATPHVRGSAAKISAVPLCRNALLRVTTAEHLREGLDLLLAPTALAGLLKITLRARALDDVLAVELLLHAAQCAIDGLVLANLDFDGHLNRRNRTSGERKSRLIGQAATHPSMAFFSR